MKINGIDSVMKTYISAVINYLLFSDDTDLRKGNVRQGVLISGKVDSVVIRVFDPLEKILFPKNDVLVLLHVWWKRTLNAVRRL